MSAYTPGPWIESAKDVDGVVVENYREISGGAKYEATEDQSQWGHDCLRICGFISPANARLIAAAPDLLELAKQYASECGECNGTGYLGRNAEPAAAPCPDCADIRAVIAKAEGA